MNKSIIVFKKSGGVILLQDVPQALINKRVFFSWLACSVRCQVLACASHSRPTSLYRVECVLVTFGSKAFNQPSIKLLM